MDKFTLGYSVKNILFPEKHEFILFQTNKIVEFTKRIRWKIHFYLDPSDSHQEQRQGGMRLNSQRTPSSNRKLDPFEDDLFGLIRKINFRNTKNGFQTKMKGDIERMKKSGKIWVRAEKPKNICQIIYVNKSKFLIIRSQNPIE